MLPQGLVLCPFFFGVRQSISEPHHIQAVAGLRESCTTEAKHLQSMRKSIPNTTASSLSFLRHQSSWPILETHKAHKLTLGASVQECLASWLSSIFSLGGVSTAAALTPGCRPTLQKARPISRQTVVPKRTQNNA